VPLQAQSSTPDNWRMPESQRLNPQATGGNIMEDIK
jgi:hypothetical protein